ncbi:hypothetical protein ACFLX3_05585, partial [Chloroflexota bacterium]
MAGRAFAKSNQIYATPSIMVTIQRAYLVYAKNNNDVLIDVDLELYATLPTQLVSIRLRGMGKDIYEYSNMRKLGNMSIHDNLIGSAYFLKPRKSKGQKKVKIWIKTAGGKQQI